MGKKHYDIFPELMNNFIINPKFIDLIKQHNITKPLFIISRNQYDFVKFFIEQTQPLRQQHGISLI
jgi:ankyrin repeat protein